MSSIHRGFVLVFVFLALALPIWAAGTAEEDSGPEAESSGESSSDGAGMNDFPVTIEHAHGSTTVEQAPERVVSVGYSDHDILLALGVTPVGVRDWYGGYDYATWPWAQDELGEAQPEIIGSQELDIEAIAALDPDLIIGVNTGMTREVYDLLAQVAPTIGPSTEFPNFGTPWQVRTRMVGRAVGQAEAAEQAVTSIEERFSGIRESNPEFENATIAVAFQFQSSPGAYASKDVRSRLMESLGFEIPEMFDEMAGESFFASFSEERLDLLDTDVIVWIASSDEGKEAIKALSMRDGLTAAAEGREIFLGKLLGGAFSFASPLSIPFLLDEMVPGLQAAVDGNPDTQVPADLR